MSFEYDDVPEPVTEPGFIFTVSLTLEQRAALDEIKALRQKKTGVRPSVRDLMNDAVKQFIAHELSQRF